MKYISGIFRTGAVRKTPRKIIEKILAGIPATENSLIIEFGAGKGEITKRIMEKAGKNKISYYAFEIDKKFTATLKKEVPGILVISENAFEFDKYIPAGCQADQIISSIPLSFYSRPELTQLLKIMQQRLTENGRIIILLHAFWLIPFLKKQLAESRLYIFKTIPPYFLLIFDK